MKLRILMGLFTRRAWHVLAEWEDGLWDPVKSNGGPGLFRRQELRHLHVRRGAQLSTRPGLMIYRKGNLELGERVSLGHNTRIFNYAKITIGNDFLSAGDLILNSGTHDPDTLKPRSEEIHIGQRVWCGERVTILAGVSIGDDVVIGAGAVVVNNIPSGVVVGGVPARVLRPLERSGNQPIWSFFVRSQPKKVP